MTTYAEIRGRAKDSAKYLVDECCDFESAIAANTCGAWESYLESLDSFDIYDCAHTEADSWDVVIYTGKALDLIANTWSSELNQAEESMQETGFEFSDFGQTCCTLAYWIVYHAMTEALENYIAEMQEFAADMQLKAEES